MTSSNEYRFPFAKYPAVRMVLCLVTGIIWGKAFSGFNFVELGGWIVGFVGIGVHLGVGQDSLNLSRTRIHTFLYLAFIVLSGKLLYNIHSFHTQNYTQEILQLSDWDEGEFKGVILKVTRNGNYEQRGDIRILKTELGSMISEEVFDARLLLTDQEHVLVGDTLSFKATIIPIASPRNPEQFDYKKFLAKQDIFVQLKLLKMYQQNNNEKRLSWAFWQNKALVSIDNLFSEKAAPVARALLLGEKSELAGDDKQAFSRAGLSHIMAVSGLHVGFVVAPFWLIFPFFWEHRKGKYLTFMALFFTLLIYAGVTGFSASVIRASCMALFLSFGKLFHKSPNSVNLTAAAAILMLIIKPNDLFEIGFQLSFAAVFIILLIMPQIQRRLPFWVSHKWYGVPISAMIISLVVQIGLYPIQVFYFGEISLISPLANAIFIPFLGVIIPLGLLAVIFAELSFYLGVVTAWPVDIFITLLQSFVQWTTNFESAWYKVDQLSIWYFPLWLAMILGISSLRIPKFRWKWLSTSMVILCVIQLQDLYQKLSANELEVVVFDVGQGDATLIKTPNDKIMLIDAGLWSPSGNSGERVILPYLRSQGITKIDAIILSHPHADHIGGVLAIVEEIEVGMLYESSYEYDSDLYYSYQRLLDELNVPVQKVRSGDKIDIDPSVLLLVLGPEEVNESEDVNEYSVVINLIYGETEFLFTGDAGFHQEERIIENYAGLLDIDWLKVGHHGSRFSTGEEFLNKSTPEMAVISNGIRNRYDHPHSEAILRLKDSDSEIFYTSRDKALLFTSDTKKVYKTEW